MLYSGAQLEFDYADVAFGVKSSKDVAKISCAHISIQLELFFEGKLQKTPSLFYVVKLVQGNYSNVFQFLLA